MANNYKHYRRVGATGGMITDTLSDANGAKNLDGWTDLVIVALHPGSDAEKFRQAITPDADQTNNPGQISYQPVDTDVDTAVSFRFYYEGRDPDNNLWYFPTDDPDGDRSYGTLVIY
jgi:hypothetical protein